MRNKKDKLAELRDALRRMRRCVARVAVLVASTGLLAYSRVYLPHLLTDPPAPFHRRLCAELDAAMQGGARLIGALPREHAKTTLGTVALVLREVTQGLEPRAKGQGEERTTSGGGFCRRVGSAQTATEVAATGAEADRDVRVPSEDADTAVRATKRNILIVGANLREAQGKLRQVVHELESNSLLRLAYRKQCAPARDPYGRVVAYADGEIVLAGGARVSCLGFGGKVRGQLERGTRLDLIVLDDPEDDQSTASPARRERLRRWVFSALLNALDVKTGSLVWLGTLLHHAGVLAQALAQHEVGAGPRAEGPGEETDLASGGGFGRREVAIQTATEVAATGSGKWRTLRLAALDDRGNPLWPGRWTRARLLARRAEIGERAFAQEYLNQPQSLAEQLFFDERWNVYDPGRLALCEGRWEYGGRPLRVAIGVDPAIGLDKTHDCFAAVVVGLPVGAAFMPPADRASPVPPAGGASPAPTDRVNGMSPQALVLEVRRFRRAFPAQLECIRGLAQHWLPQVIGIESVAYQAALKQAAFEQGLPVVELKGSRRKAARIEALAAQVQRGGVALPVHGPWVARLREEAAQYPSGKHDDQLDALAYALECGLGLLGAGPLDVYAAERQAGKGL